MAMDDCVLGVASFTTGYDGDDLARRLVVLLFVVLLIC
jgi:hypothetical protein